MRRWEFAVLLTVATVSQAAPPAPKTIVTGLANPESVAVDPGGRVYVSCIGAFGKDGDGTIQLIVDGKATVFATGLDDPKGLVAFGDFLFVADKTRVWRIGKDGKAEVFAAAEAFPTKPQFLNDLAVDETGTLYVSDSGDLQGRGGAIYRINAKSRKVSLIANSERSPLLASTNGLLNDSMAHLYALDFATGVLSRVAVADGRTEKVAEGFGGGDGLCFDKHGRLYLSDWKGGRVFVIGRPGEAPVELASGLQAAADICLDPTGKFVLVPDMKAGTLVAIPTGVPGAPVDETPVPLNSVIAFPNLEWDGWKAETASGKNIPLRPIELTHAGDGSNRVFVATQHGVIHVFPNDQNASKTKVFLDIEKRVTYNDNQNEEGFLGLTFHPKYKENGEFFVFYTVRAPKQTNVVSRFRVSKDDPDRADPASEEEVFRISHPFWNHDGGTIVFGPDGYLYIALGDGGAANDPFENGQNLGSLLGKVLRIDVDRKDAGKKYGIPKDNPFVDRPGAKPEIWCYGLRNIWRMAFDRETGKLWGGEVGQNLWEEIVILTAGGNYGWNLREALHPFGPKGVGPKPELIEPIWEYFHDINKSITGGLVYRGKQFPELAGAYLYADYVSGIVWALWYDEEKKRVTANRTIPVKPVPVLSFGEDEQGEVYYMTYSASGRGIYRFVRPSGAAPK